MSASTIMVTRSSKAVVGFQPKVLVGLGGVADEEVDLGGPEELLVDDDVVLVAETEVLERDGGELTDAVGLAGADDVVVGFGLLEHVPHRGDVVAGEAPVSFGVEVPQRQRVDLAQLDAGRAVGDLAGHELEAASGALVVEQDARAGVQVVALAVVDRDPVPVDLRHAVRDCGDETAWIRSGAPRRPCRTSRCSTPDRSGCRGSTMRIASNRRVTPRRGGLTGQHRLTERGLHERLRGEVVDLVGLMGPQHVDQADLIQQITVAERDRILEMRDPLVVHGARPPHHADTS